MTMKQVLEQQYQNASNLNARMALHRRFSTNPTGWFPWYFEQLDFPPTCRVLELGCGPASLWKENLGKVKTGCRLILTDFSPGMVHEAAQIDDPQQRFSFAAADAQTLPFPSASFDIVIANHMLYHVPDLDRALSEIRRVLRPDGRFYAATNGERHMAEVYALEDRLSDGQNNETAPPLRLWSSSFTLENGSASLRRHFSTVELRHYPDGLRVTEVQPLVDYVLSMIGHFLRRIPQESIEALRQQFEEEIRANGYIPITKSSGVFIAQ
jgi:ubiquinone/menaquinone biosynthesis C-methylase UbiE